MYTKRILKFPPDQRVYHRRVAENAEKSHKNLCELGVSVVKSENSTCAWYRMDSRLKRAGMTDDESVGLKLISV
jgi:hypothetical protein